MSAPLFHDDVLFYQRLLKAQGYYTDILDGDWGPNTDEADQRFIADGEALKAQIGTFDQRSEGHIATLHIKTQAAARRFLAAATQGPLTCRIISGTRTYSEQNALFAKGRFGNPGPRVTNARGGQSNHNFGIAWDIGLFDGGQYIDGDTASEVRAYEDIASRVNLNELEWGGNWTSFRDIPHYQLPTNLGITAVREKFEAGAAYV